MGIENIPTYRYVAEASLRYSGWPNKKVAKETAKSLEGNDYYGEYFEYEAEQIIILRFGAVLPKSSSEEDIQYAFNENMKTRKSMLMSLRDQTKSVFGKHVYCRLNKECTKLVFSYKEKPKMKMIRPSGKKPGKKGRKVKYRKPRKRF